MSDTKAPNSDYAAANPVIRTKGLYLLETYGDNSVEWAPREDRPFSYVEACHYEKLKSCLHGVNFRCGGVRESDVEAWLQRRVSICPRGDVDTVTKLCPGAIRNI